MKRLLLLALCAILANLAFADTVSEKQALQIATQFANGNGGFSFRKNMAVTNRHLSLSHALKSKDGRNNLYIFNADGGSQGYVVVSGETGTVAPVLAYSDEGSIDYEKASDNFKYWMQFYSDQIDYLRSHPEVATEASTTVRGASDTYVAPLLKSKWGQGSPFNKDCPLGPSGCVATAMAQIMYYWKWPEQGRGHHTNVYYPEQSIDFSQSTYAWDKMLDDYSTGAKRANNNAVAKLVGDCGASVDMMYGESGSGAYNTDVAPALIRYFKYYTSTKLVTRDSYSKEDWEELILEELIAQRPVYYAGGGEKGGHAFVCDGYNNGYFHINLGWNGSESKFYLLDAINTNSGDFNNDQEAVIGIQPDYDGAVSDPSIVYSVTEDGNACLDFLLDTQGTITNLDIPETVVIEGVTRDVTEIGASAFSGCEWLTKVNIPQSVTSIYPMAFQNCTGLTDVTMPDSIDLIGSDIFNGCTSLKNVTLPKNLYSIFFGMFYGCKSLESITWPETLKSIGEYAFYDSGLKAVHIPQSVNEIECASFGKCNALERITVDEANPTYDSREGCNAIIEKSTKRLVQACNKTTFPKGIAIIGENSFDGFEGFESLTIPSSVTQLDDDAFADCVNLKSIYLPKSIAKIGERQFRGCTSLTDVYNYATTPQSIKDDAFDTYGTLHVEANCVNAYQAAEGWKNFTITGDQVNGILHTKANNSKKATYDLWGRKANATSKGLFINNNKKIYIK